MLPLHTIGVIHHLLIRCLDVFFSHNVAADAAKRKHVLQQPAAFLISNLQSAAAMTTQVPSTSSPSAVRQIYESFLFLAASEFID